MNLPVFIEDRRIAEIRVDAEGICLRYAPEWREARGAYPISLTMLLAATRALGMALEDVLGLVERMGRDLAGALAIGAPRAGNGADPVAVDTPQALERIIEELPAKPFLVGEGGVSMSLAGAQEKLPLARRDGVLAIPVDGAPSTLILKPDNPRLPGSVANEALCMVLARRCGLAVAGVTTGVAGARRYLLVERYDRETGNERVLRRHQDGFCQALGRPPAAKYEHNRSGMKGPSLAEMFELVRTHMTARETTRLLDAVIFNVAVGNVDSHAKNYSILLGPGRPTLAPLYDLMSGLAWSGITRNHAQDIGGRQRGRHVLARHWRRMALAAGLSGPATVRRVIQLAGRVTAELTAARAEVAAMPAGGGDMLGVFANEIAVRARLVATNARDESEAGAGGEPPEAMADDGVYPGQSRSMDK